MYTFESKSILQFAVSRRMPPLAPEIDLPEITDLAGYDALTNLIRREKLDRVPGDFLEIGCFLGGGTAKLARIAESAAKQVWVIDVFDPAFDVTRNAAGDRMSDLCRGFLQGKTQEQVFRHVTARSAKSIRVLKQDSMRVRFPDEQRFAFAFTDGNHDPRWVTSDFHLVWRHLSVGGWAGFHDYQGDLPEVTAALDALLYQYRDQIGRVEVVKDRWILLVEKTAKSEASL